MKAAGFAPEKDMARVKHAAVWLIRSGPTVWEDEGRLVGSADIPLGEAGLAAAQDRAKSVAGQKLSGIISAPGEASLETARLIARVSGEKFKVIDDLADPSLGLWEGMRESDLEDRSPTVYRQWKDDPLTVSVPNGESMERARDRMIEVLRRLVPKYASAEGTLAVILRPTALGMARCYLEGVPSTQLWDLAFGGDGIQRLTLDCDRLRERLGLRAVMAPTAPVESAIEALPVRPSIPRAIRGTARGKVMPERRPV